jgi:CheY-like chemotaxis protein
MFNFSSILLFFSLWILAVSNYAMSPHLSNDEENDETHYELPMAKTELSSSNDNLLIEPNKTEPLRIIVADDSLLCRITMRNHINRLGDVVVIMAKNGEELIEAVLKHACDIIITDGEMPVMDGPEAIKIIRKTHKDLPIFIHTANTDQNFQRKCLDSEVTAVWSKPTTNIIIQAALLPYRRGTIPPLLDDCPTSNAQNPTKQATMELDEHRVN